MLILLNLLAAIALLVWGTQIVRSGIMCVFGTGRAKHRFRRLTPRYSLTHVEQLSHQNTQSLETSSLHLGLLREMKRLNSLFCSVAYGVLDQREVEEE